MRHHLNVLSIGAGAIGTYIGGSLALKGHKVVFIEKPKALKTISSQGLALKIRDSKHLISKPEITSSIGKALENDYYDVTLFALKSYDTDSFIKSLNIDPKLLPPFLVLSNGVENEPTLAQEFGWEKVIPATVTSAVRRITAGNIIVERLRGVGLSANHPLSEDLAAAMQEAGLKPRLYTKATGMKWSKLLTNLISNSTSAILNMHPGNVYTHQGLFRLEVMQLREVLSVMRAQGIRVINLPGTPVQLLAFVVRFVPLTISQPLLTKFVTSGRGGKMPSFYIDLHEGDGKSEVDYLNGAVVRAGIRNSVPTPVNRFLNDILLGLISGEISKEFYQNQPEKLLSDFHTHIVSN